MKKNPEIDEKMPPKMLRLKLKESEKDRVKWLMDKNIHNKQNDEKWNERKNQEIIIKF